MYNVCVANAGTFLALVVFTHLILRHCKTRVVNPPQNSTVTMTITSVVVKISCLSLDWVFLMASANAMAPLKPSKRNST